MWPGGRAHTLHTECPGLNSDTEGKEKGLTFSFHHIYVVVMGGMGEGGRGRGGRGEGELIFEGAYFKTRGEIIDTHTSKV